MADLVYRAGVQALLDHLVDSTVTLENATNCFFALLTQPAYVAAETDATMDDIVSNRWDGLAANGGYSTTSPRVIAVADVSTGIDSDGKVQLILPTLEFGNVTEAGSPVNGCVIFMERATTPADTDRFPLLYLSSSVNVQPVESQNLTWVANSSGNVLWDPNP